MSCVVSALPNHLEHHFANLHAGIRGIRVRASERTTCRLSASIAPGTIALNQLQRIAGNIEMTAPMPVSPFRVPRGNFPMSQVTLEVDSLSKLDKTFEINATEFATFVRTTFQGHVYRPGQMFAAKWQDKSWKLTVKGFEYIDMSQYGTSAIR